MKYYEIELAALALKKLGEYKLPRKIKMAIIRNSQKLTDIIKTISDERNKLAKEYCLLDDKGEFILEEKDGQKLFKFESPEKMNAYLRESNELLACEENVDIIKVKSSDLELCDTNDRFDILSIEEEASIAWMIDYED